MRVQDHFLNIFRHSQSRFTVLVAYGLIDPGTEQQPLHLRDPPNGGSMAGTRLVLRKDRVMQACLTSVVDKVVPRTSISTFTDQ